MIFTAMLLMCEMNMPKTFDNCIVFIDEHQHRSEQACMDSIVELLNNELFQNAYSRYDMEDYQCYSWIHTET